MESLRVWEALGVVAKVIVLVALAALALVTPRVVPIALDGKAEALVPKAAVTTPASDDLMEHPVGMIEAALDAKVVLVPLATVRETALAVKAEALAARMAALGTHLVVSVVDQTLDLVTPLAIMKPKGDLDLLGETEIDRAVLLELEKETTIETMRTATMSKNVVGILLILGRWTKLRKNLTKSRVTWR